MFRPPRSPRASPSEQPPRPPKKPKGSPWRPTGENKDPNEGPHHPEKEKRPVLGEKLGEGDQACVYDCPEEGGAVKVLYSCHEEKPREVAHLEVVQGCPHVLKLLKAWQAGNTWFILTELCDGDRQCSGVKEAEQLLWEMCKALHHCHTYRDVAHLDIKFDNVLRKDGTWVLADFGLSRQISLGEYEEGDSTTMAPELLQDGAKLDLNKADVFSLGLTVLERATGYKLPLGGEEWQKLRRGNAAEVLEKEGDNLASSPALQHALKWMLKTEPAERPSCKQLLEAHRTGVWPQN